jgi:hypothetical protein
MDESSLCGDVVMSSRQPEVACVCAQHAGAVLSIQINTNVPSTHQELHWRSHQHPKQPGMHRLTMHPHHNLVCPVFSVVFPIRFRANSGTPLRLRARKDVVSGGGRRTSTCNRIPTPSHAGVSGFDAQPLYPRHVGKGSVKGAR